MFVPSLALGLVLALSQSSPNSPGDTAPGSKAKITEEAGDITGYFTCKGVEAGGKNYTGVAAISKKGDVYLIQWMIGTGSTFSGIGIRNGNNLAVSWAIPNERGMVRGVNLYRIEAGPRLVGRWATVPGPGVMQSETLTFLKGLDAEE